MGDRKIQAVIGSKEAERERDEGDQKNYQKYKYERVPTDASDVSASHIEDAAEESDPELELEIERDTFQRKHSNLETHLRSFQKGNRGRLVTMAGGIVGVLLFLYWAVM
jgi:hypothetical protein